MGFYDTNNNRNRFEEMTLSKTTATSKTGITTTGAGSGSAYKSALDFSVTATKSVIS